MGKNNWGQLTAIDLFNCGSDLLKDKEKLKEFVLELCDKIGMKPFGKPLVERFGEGDLEGNSLMMFIETSCITAHIDETNNRAFIDVFSCKLFDEKVAENFSKEFFKAGEIKSRTIFRG